jgi:hypothetical protein
MRACFSCIGALFVVTACGGSAAPPATAPPSAPSAAPAVARTQEPVGTGEPAAAKAPSEAAPATESGGVDKRATELKDLFEKVRSVFDACYAEGKKKAPAMAEGKVTFHAAVDPAGKTTCVVPSDDTGLTPEVEDCMQSRLAKETFSPGASWTYQMPVLVSDGAATLGTAVAKAPAIDTIDAEGVKNAGPVVEKLLPELHACVRKDVDGASRLKVLYVAARVRRDGSVECALATGATAVPQTIRDCAATTMGRAKFSPPKAGRGVVAVPLKVVPPK